MPDILDNVYFNNAVSDYLIFITLVLAGFAFVFIVKKILLSRSEKDTHLTTDNTIRLAIAKYLLPVLYLITLRLSSLIIITGSTVNKIINIILLALITYFAALFIITVSVFFISKYWEKKNKSINAAASKFLGGAVKIIVWAAAVFLFLENAGIKITAIVAGLGIGGIAVAFAAQTILEDVFGYFSILFDKPFETGDYIKTGSYSGDVEHIGVKTTRIRSINGEQIIVSNKLLINDYLQNFKTLEKRRVIFNLALSYDNTYEKLKAIPPLIKDVIKRANNTEFERAHLSEFSDAGIIYEIVYFVKSENYNVYMDIKQEINFKIKEEFEKKEIKFAAPVMLSYFKDK